MRISFWISTIVFYYVVNIVSLNCIQVGTVLFTTTDIVKKCWSESDKALLRARYIMQGGLLFTFIISPSFDFLFFLNNYENCFNSAKTMNNN